MTTVGVDFSSCNISDVKYNEPLDIIPIYRAGPKGKKHTYTLRVGERQKTRTTE